MSARIDEIIKEAERGTGLYAEYTKQREIVAEKQNALEFRVGRTTISFKCDSGRTRIFIGPTEMTQVEATSLARGLLDCLEDHEQVEEGDTPEATEGGQ